MVPDISTEALIKCCEGGVELGRFSKDSSLVGWKQSNPQRQSELFLTLHDESLKMLLFFLTLTDIILNHTVRASLHPSFIYSNV